MSTYLEPYRESHKQHGSDFNVTLWANRKSQFRRFEVFAGFDLFQGKRVLDAGCSRGDLAAYLLRRGIDFARYVGVDGICEVVDYARQRGLPRCEFYCGDFLDDPSLLRRGRPEVICISGTLNTMADEQVRQALDLAWEAAGETLMFNFLSDRVAPAAPAQQYPARRLDTMAMLDWALSRTSQVVFRQDYFPAGHDATIVMKKN